MLIACAYFVGSISLLVSAAVRTAPWALLWSYIAVGSWLLLPAGLDPLARRAVGPLSWPSAIADAIRQSHPLEAAMSLWKVPMSEIFYPPGVAWAWSGVSRFLPRAVGIQLACSMLFLILAVRLIRPRRLEAARPRGREPATPPRPAVGDDPLLWKERYAHASLSRRAAGIVIALLVVLVVYPLIEPAAASFREWRASWWDQAAGRLWARGSLNELLRKFSAGLYLIGLAAVAAMAATSVSGERERGTWTSLAMTLITGREVARAKVSGALGPCAAGVPFAILWVIGLATGSVHPIGVLASAVGLVIFARYGAAVGVLCSMASPTSGRAIVGALARSSPATSSRCCFVPIDLIGSLAGTWQTVYLAGVTPFVEWIALASPVEIRSSFEGRTWEEAIRLPGGLWGRRVALDPGLIRTYLVSLVLHAIGPRVRRCGRRRGCLIETDRDRRDGLIVLSAPRRNLYNENHRRRIPPCSRIHYVRGPEIVPGGAGLRPCRDRRSVGRAVKCPVAIPSNLPMSAADFENRVRPLLAARCVKCHGPRKQESNLRLDSRAAMMQGGDSGPAIVPGKAEESLLVKAIRHEGDIQMPPDARLKDEQITR